ncbi:mitochondrial uncoupling protein 3 [Magnolia sinica]|uniref:mitochondrial uncoupling protein 3 n=1 Tax=Magnolia sinica TaxID=86752 RepID=UPI002658BB6C|nr:mitochondrial uncoupling protein 3 [Magnolia sinica]XP_058096375.1 mitochondrial uncoupling protein 3 [Magnolia sinica]XP_058096376.1 mitochondrial uncoupling protein 3 [Magnolia sinica]XP_058096377.1 mitochondrial uncoupling protein 3 [Magnolia sinica]XP_058096378.1 mitochondrial uncoupling protein 3 [Magnolia sinica]XP_058096379.1 mitochondrial uncoupling protein 3 [Magnolia sinica]XP_058096380.1 mitochondrial uncoupling protein 3 [Magnolia sinica]
MVAEGGEGKEGNQAYKKMLLTSMSAMVAETATFPIDITKTRLQLFRTQSSHLLPSPNAFRVASDIFQRQGLSGLYQGLSPAIIRHLFYTPLRILSYEHLRLAVPSDSLSAKALVGGISGVFAQVVASPADLVKVRMQADSRLVGEGLPPRYKGIIDALSKIVRTEGFWGLWRGVFPNSQRAFLVNMGELACYDHAKRFIVGNQVCGDNIYAHTLASIMSGLSATTLSCPADVVKTRMMNQSSGKDTKFLYRNSYDCLLKTVKHEGILAMWKGFFPTWARLGPWQFVFWVSYEKFRRLAGLSSF